MPADRFVRERFERLSRGHQASELQVKGREQAAGFDVLRIEGEQFLEGSRGPAVLAGIHVGDRFFEESALLAVADDAALMHA